MYWHIAAAAPTSSSNNLPAYFPHHCQHSIALLYPPDTEVFIVKQLVHQVNDIFSLLDDHGSEPCTVALLGQGSVSPLQGSWGCTVLPLTQLCHLPRLKEGAVSKGARLGDLPC
jgi:hypothetical protein